MKELNQHRNPVKMQISEQPWFFCLNNLPKHPSITLNKEIICEDADVTIQDYILKIRRPKLTKAPELPKALIDWLEDGWENPYNECQPKESLDTEDIDGNIITEFLSDCPERIEKFNEWKVKRDNWVEKEVPARESMKVFEQIYELYGHMQKESEKLELVLGDGILKWRHSDKITINHPILLQRLYLEFNPSVPEFIFRETDHDVELYSPLFSSMYDIDGKIIAQCREELAEGSFHPLGGNDTSGFFRRFVAQLSARGNFVEPRKDYNAENYPQVSRGPVFLPTLFD